MSNVMDTLKQGTRRIAGWFGAEKTVGKPGSEKRREKAGKERRKRRNMQFSDGYDSLGQTNRRSIERQRARSGRAATILSDNERLGG